MRPFFGAAVASSVSNKFQQAGGLARCLVIASFSGGSSGPHIRLAKFQHLYRFKAQWTNNIVSSQILTGRNPMWDRSICAVSFAVKSWVTKNLVAKKMVWEFFWFWGSLNQDRDSNLAVLQVKVPKGPLFLIRLLMKGVQYMCFARVWSSCRHQRLFRGPVVLAWTIF